MLGVEDYFKVEQIYILNAYFDETDKNRLIERLEGNKKRISDLYLKDDLQKIINRIKDLDDLEFETCMASLPYEEFQTEEEIKKERENLIIKDKQKAFITQYGIVDEGDIVDEEDLHEYMDTENTMEE